MTRRLTFLQGLGALVLFCACASFDEAEEAVESESVEFASNDPAEVERQREVSRQADIDYPPGVLLDEWEREHGPVERLGPNDTLGRFMNDQPGGEEEDLEQVEKGLGNRWPALTGWAVKSITDQDDNGLDHWVPKDSNYLNRMDANDDLLGRCGRSGTQIDLSWQPCILPHAQDPAVGAKIKKWIFKANSCPTGTKRDILKEGIKRAFAGVNNSANDWIFNEVTVEDADTWVVQCADAIDKADMGNSIGTGTPLGPLAISHFRSEFSLAIEGCEPQGATQAYWFNHDVVSTYRKGLVTINWDMMWTVVQGCTTVVSSQYTAIRTLVLHELGHIFGYQHFLDNTQFSNIMQPGGTTTCQVMLGGFLYRPYMNDALNTYSMPVRPELPLETFDEDISCYKPGSQPTQ